MDEQTAKNQKENSTRKSLNKQDSLVLKIVLIAFLILLSFIPMSMIRGLRNEAPIDKLMESLESKESQWGESDPLDMDENLVHEKTTFGKSDTISA